VICPGHCSHAAGETSSLPKGPEYTYFPREVYPKAESTKWGAAQQNLGGRCFCPPPFEMQKTHPTPGHFRELSNSCSNGLQREGTTEYGSKTFQIFFQCRKHLLMSHLLNSRVSHACVGFHSFIRFGRGRALKKSILYQSPAMSHPTPGSTT
jgi:hypothetical protein